MNVQRLLLNQNANARHWLVTIKSAETSQGNNVRGLNSFNVCVESWCIRRIQDMIAESRAGAFTLKVQVPGGGVLPRQNPTGQQRR